MRSLVIDFNTARRCCGEHLHTELDKEHQPKQPDAAGKELRGKMRSRRHRLTPLLISRAPPRNKPRHTPQTSTE